MRRHGTYVMYVQGLCRCDDCRAANRDASRARARRRARETYHPDEARLVDADPVRAHLATLTAAGMGLKTVARIGGVAHGTLSAIVYGKTSRDPREVRPPRRRVTRDVADRILAIRPVLADGAKVDATGTRRRLQGLVAIGWPQSRLCADLGLTPANATGLFNGRRTLTRASTARAVTALYGRLSATPGPSSRARNDAVRRGWVGPAWWDDDALDDPAVTPFDLPAGADPMAVAHLTGMTSVAIARVFRVSDFTVSRRLAAAGFRLSEQDPAHVRLVEDWHDTWDYHLGDLDIAAARLGVARSTLASGLSRADRDGVAVRRAVSDGGPGRPRRQDVA